VAVRVRLTRVGSRKNPVWRVVVADGRSKRDGRVLETVGRYNPQRQPSEIVLDRERIEHWIARGAQPSETVRSLLRATDREAPPERAAPDTNSSAGRPAGGALGPDPGDAGATGSAAPAEEPGEDFSEATGGGTEEDPTVADVAPADAAGAVDEEASERATAAGGG
jgi:small subunit ribosomal protein S16